MKMKTRRTTVAKKSFRTSPSVENTGRRTANTNNTWEGNVYVYNGGKVEDDERQTIEHVRVDESVPVICEKTFHKCKKLQTIEFPTTKNRENILMIKEIGTGSFIQCYSLLSINLQNTQVETIGDRTFYDCIQLATVQFPSSIRKIGKSCFQHCRQLSYIDLSHANEVESIEEGTFYGCIALKAIKLPATMLCIGRTSFHSCDALEVIDLRGTRVNKIGSSAFRFCSNLTAIYFPATTESIGQGSFFGCKKLSFLNLQTTSVERIENDAFAYCYGLTKINLPKTVNYIGYYSFGSCIKLECINLHQTSIGKIGQGAFRGCKNLKSVAFGMDTDDENVFHGDDDDSDVYMKLPASLEEVGKGAFLHCPRLQNVNDTNGIQYVCDINRGGRIFLQRHHDHNQDNDGDDGNDSSNGDAKRHGKVYYSSLWPLILYRVLNEMKLPQDRICSNDDDLSSYTDADPLQRRGGVVFYLLIHGVIADLQTTTLTS